jgi:hypothetical protein
MAQEPGFAADSGIGGNVRQRNFRRKMCNLVLGCAFRAAQRSLATLRISAGGSDACKTAQKERSLATLGISPADSRSAVPRSRLQNGSTKTGAYSPPRFSAPALKPFRDIGRTRPLIYFRPTCSQSRGQCAYPATRKSRVSGGPGRRSLIHSRCLAAARRVNSKAGPRYLLSR